jgi:hypothetical protein
LTPRSSNRILTGKLSTHIKKLLQRHSKKAKTMWFFGEWDSNRKWMYVLRGGLILMAIGTILAITLMLVHQSHSPPPPEVPTQSSVNRAALINSSITDLADSIPLTTTVARRHSRKW